MHIVSEDNEADAVAVAVASRIMETNANGEVTYKHKVVLR